jgi:hypothetical protein
MPKKKSKPKPPSKKSKSSPVKAERKALPLDQIPQGLGGKAFAKSHPFQPFHSGRKG